MPLPALYCWERCLYAEVGQVENHMKVFFVRGHTSDGVSQELSRAVVPRWFIQPYPMPVDIQDIPARYRPAGEKKRCA